MSSYATSGNMASGRVSSSLSAARMVVRSIISPQATVESFASKLYMVSTSSGISFRPIAAMFKRPSDRAPSIRLRSTDLPPFARWLKGSSSRPKSKLAISAGSGTMTSVGGVLFLGGSVFACFAACLAFAICSLNAFDELAGFGGVSAAASPPSDRFAAFALAMWSRRALEELGILRTVSGVLLTGASLLGEETAVPGGDMVCP
jgi:hypothetical protein